MEEGRACCAFSQSFREAFVVDAVLFECRCDVPIRICVTV